MQPSNDGRPAAPAAVAVRPGGMLREFRRTQTLLGSLAGELVAARTEIRFVSGARAAGATRRLAREHPVEAAFDLAPRAFVSFAYTNGDAPVKQSVLNGAAL